MITRKAIAASTLVALFAFATGSAWAQGAAATTPTTPATTTPTMAVTPVKPAAKPAAAAAAKPATKPAATAAAATGPRSIIGEIVDPACWIVNGAKGDSHKECAVACAKSGQTLAIVDKKTGKIYYSLTDKPGEDPNKGLIEYVGQMVTVKGKVFTRGGAVGIKVTSIEPYTAPREE